MSGHDSTADKTGGAVERRLLKIRRQIAGIVASGMLAMGATVGVTIVYVKYDGDRRDRDWCHMLGLLVDPDPSVPTPGAENPRGRAIVKEAQRMRAERGC